MNEFFEQLDALYQAGNMPAIEEFLRQYLRDLQLSGKEDNPEAASAVNELAGFYRGVSRYEESAEQFAKALQILEQNGMKETLQYATILLNLAGLYRLMGNPKSAVSMFYRAKEILIACDMQHEYAYAGVLNNLSLAYQDIGDFNNAYINAFEAYQIMLQKESSDHEIATSLNNLAVICFKIGEYGKAATLIDDALSRYALMREENVHHASALSTKASLLYHSGLFPESLSYFIRALMLTEKFFGKNIEYAAGERNISMVYEALGNIESALEHMKYALSVIETILGTENARTQEYRASVERLASLGKRL